MSTAWLDVKYINLISFRLRNFKRKGDNLFNFSCPICGDSTTNQHKARGFVVFRKGKYRYYCHNCNVSGYDVPKLVKYLDQNLYNEYLREKLKDNPPPRLEVHDFADKMKPPVFQATTPLKHLKKVSAFESTSSVKKWVQSRRIPPEYHFKLYYCSKFYDWVNRYVIPGKFEESALKADEPRLVIPFLDEEENLIGFQGRSLKKNSSLRYITIMIDENKPKIYGLEQLNRDKLIYVVEGPIDSMFLPNAIAAAGGSLMANLDTIGVDKDKFVIVYDHDPRNPQIVSKVDKAINAGYKVCVWPSSIKEGDDINDLIQKRGLTPKQVVKLIEEHTFEGLEAKLHFSKWKKV